MKSKVVLVSIATFLFLSCNRPIEIEGFDPVLWKNDPYACKGERAKQIRNLFHNKEKIIGLREQQVVELLGKPDIKDLYKRGQKFFLYYTDSQNDKCDTSFVGKPSLLRIRFSAIELSNEVTLEEQ